MKLPRRNFLQLAAGAAALPAVPRFACAQTYPSSLEWQRIWTQVMAPSEAGLGVAIAEG